MLDYEWQVVSALLRAPGRHEARVAGVKLHWFRDKLAQTFLKLLLKRPMTLRTAAEYLGRSVKGDKLREAMLTKLAELSEAETLEDSEIDHAARSIVSRAKEEHLLDRVRWTLEQVEEQKVNKAEEVIHLLSSELNGFRLESSDPQGIADLAQANLLEYRARAAKGESTYLATGIEKLDDVVGGGQRGELWLWGGYANEGKTSLCFASAYNVWVTGGTTMWIPNEMTKQQMTTMLIARHSVTLYPDAPIEARSIRRGTLDAEEYKKYRAVVRDIKEREADRKRWHIWEPARGATIVSIGKYLNAMRARYSLDLLVIDYLEQLAPVRERRSSREELNDTLGEAKVLAKTYNDGRGLWLMSPHQISRDGKKECEKRKPTPHYVMSDLAESARAERDSDVVAWVLRTRKMKSIKQLLVGVAKARGEGFGTVELGFKMMENFGCSYVGNLSEDERQPEADFDFDSAV